MWRRVLCTELPAAQCLPVCLSGMGAFTLLLLVSTLLTAGSPAAEATGPTGPDGRTEPKPGLRGPPGFPGRPGAPGPSGPPGSPTVVHVHCASSGTLVPSHPCNDSCDINIGLECHKIEYCYMLRNTLLNHGIDISATEAMHPEFQGQQTTSANSTSPRAAYNKADPKDTSAGGGSQAALLPPLLVLLALPIFWL